MAITYGELMKRLESDENIKEMIISEGNVIFFGIVKKMDKPILINGKEIHLGIEMVAQSDYGVLEKKECLDILLGFQESVGADLIPNEDHPIVMFGNHLFRLIVTDKPTSDKFNIVYRQQDLDDETLKL